MAQAPSPPELPGPDPQRRQRPVTYPTMVVRALYHLERDHPHGSTVNEIADAMGQFYHPLPPSLLDDLGDCLKLMRKKKTEFVKVGEIRYMFLYHSKLHEEFILSSAGGGLRIRGNGGDLPFMTTYPRMIVHALHTLEQGANPVGSTLAEVIARIKLLYERLPHSHNFQVEQWMPILCKKGEVATRPGARFKNVDGCKLLSSIIDAGGGFWDPQNPPRNHGNVKGEHFHDAMDGSVNL